MFGQHTMPITKEENKDDHSGHSGQWSTQPSTTSRNRGFFARMKQKAELEAQKLEKLEEPPKPSVLLRSPSLPSVREPLPREEVRRVSLFSSPPKVEKHANEHIFLRRSPSLPTINISKPHQASPMAHLMCHKTTTPNVAHNNLLNRVPYNVSMTPLQNIKTSSSAVHSSSRAPLQCITPLGQKDLKLASYLSNHKMNTLDKENVFNKKQSDSPIVNLRENTLPSGKEPTPEWKKNFMQKMREDSPIGMVMDTLATKRPNSFVSSSNKTARNLFTTSDRSSPLLQDIFRDPEPAQNRSNPPFMEKSSQYQEYSDTPVPAKKFAQQSFEFKQPSLPMQKPKDASQHDLIVVNNVPYKKGEKLGKGGSSDVFQVFRMSDEAQFALKIVHLKDADENVKKGFLNEISFLERMQGCERVIQLIDYELCEAQELLFVIMERGVRDLSAFLKDRAKRKDLRIGTVEEFWKDMVEAVAAIHDQGIIHSDLKPANFILCGEVGFHQLKIIDFGIASSIQTDMTSVIKEHPAGTLNYMSPEALQGANVKINFKSDIWSLGCILYCLLYGVTPFQHIKNYGHKTATISDPNHTISFPEKSQILPGEGVVPPGLLSIVQACLSYSPQDRPSARELLKIKFCGCDQNKQQPNSIEILAQGLTSLIQNHSLGAELSALLVASLQKGHRQTRKDSY